jgi:tripartite-type tricarboxylate transporter receptor subunit TctC
MQRSGKFAALGWGMLMSLSTVSFQAHAQAKFPDKPVRIIVPFPAGGINDNVARLVAQKLGESMQAGFIIDNRPGAGGTIGTAAAAKSAPDGYTLLLGAASTIAVAPYIYSNAGYAPARDLVAIGGLASVPSVLLTAKSDKYKQFQDLVSAAKTSPGMLTYGSAGSGSSQHVQMDLLKIRLGLDMVHVPYKGGAPAMADLMGGQIDFLLEPLPTAMAQLAGKKVTALALSKAERVPALPEVPTFTEVGVSDFLVSTWFGLFAPANTPAAIVSQLEAALNKTLQDPALVKTMKDRGIDPMPMSSKAFSQYTEQERERWKAVVAQSGIKAD